MTFDLKSTADAGLKLELQREALAADHVRSMGTQDDCCPLLAWGHPRLPVPLTRR